MVVPDIALVKEIMDAEGALPDGTSGWTGYHRARTVPRATR